MEVVLQGLDELDDLMFALLLSWDRLRSVCLAIGLAAAVLLHGHRFGISLNMPPLALAEVALACLLVWSLVSVLAVVADHRAGTAT
jgi:hypothetical protein